MGGGCLFFLQTGDVFHANNSFRKTAAADGKNPYIVMHSVSRDQLRINSVVRETQNLFMSPSMVAHAKRNLAQALCES